MAVIAPALLVACQGTRDLPKPETFAYGAELHAKNGSTVGGTVHISERADGIAIAVYATELVPGTFRVVFHANGNCSSPNAFSAGAPWAPPGMQPQPVTLYAGSEGTAVLSTRLHGYKLQGPDGLVGKAVVLHEASGSLDARPGVPNGRLACGVIGQMRTLGF